MKPFFLAAPLSGAVTLNQEENDPETGLIGKIAPVTDFGKVTWNYFLLNKIVPNFNITLNSPLLNYFVDFQFLQFP